MSLPISPVGGMSTFYLSTPSSFNPTTIGNIVIYAHGNNGDSGTITAVTGGGVSQWNRISSTQNPHSTYGLDAELWYGTVTATGSAFPFSVTGTFGGDIETGIQEFTAGPGAVWSVISSGGSATLTNTQSTGAYPTLLSTGRNQMYFGVAMSQYNGGLNGLNPNYTYQAGGYGLMLFAYGVQTSSSTNPPSWTTAGPDYESMTGAIISASPSTKTFPVVQVGDSGIVAIASGATATVLGSATTPGNTVVLNVIPSQAGSVTSIISPIATFNKASAIDGSPYSSEMWYGKATGAGTTIVVTTSAGSYNAWAGEFSNISYPGIATNTASVGTSTTGIIFDFTTFDSGAATANFDQNNNNSAILTLNTNAQNSIAVAGIKSTYNIIENTSPFAVPGSGAGIVQTASNQTGNSTTIPVVLNKSPVVGNVLVAIYGGLNGSTGNPVSPPSGFTQIQSQIQYNAVGVNSVQVATAYRIVQSGDGTNWTSTLPSGPGGVVGAVILEIQGINTSNITNNVNNGSNTSGGAPVTISNSNFGDIVLGIAAIFTDYNASNPWSIGSGASTGWSYVQTQQSASYYGALAVYANQTTNAGSVVSFLTATPVNNQNYNYIEVILNLPSTAGFIYNTTNWNYYNYNAFQASLGQDVAWTVASNQEPSAVLWTPSSAYTWDMSGLVLNNWTPPNVTNIGMLSFNMSNAVNRGANW